jgi:anti-sigma factor ChrR (cupin superfamily)
MKIRADFSERVSVRPGEEPFVPSPQAGVDRVMLDRIGGEIARATSFVRFAPGSFFPFHEHGGGEEVFVLDGVFEDEHGSYPAGTYLRDPVGTSHRPFTKGGCTLFVKLWQFAPGDTERKVIDTKSGSLEPTAVPGLESQALHEFAGVSVTIEKLAPGFSAARTLHRGGEEILVLDGSLALGSENFPKGSWLRDSGRGSVELGSETGCMLLVTKGHLARVVVPA